MEQQCSLEENALFNLGRVLTAANLHKFLNVLGIGLLLGVLVSMPYDQLFGLSDTLHFAVQSMISIFVFASLLSNWPSEVTVERACFL